MDAPLKTNRRVYEDIAEALAEKIHSGELKDGSLLPSERELAEQFGASRTSVREALLSLQAAGLISVRQSARARVTQLDNAAFLNQLSTSAQSLLSRPGGMSDFQEARLLFECGLVRYAARYASPKEIERLRIALGQNKKSVNDPAAFAATDLAFHNILAEIPQNPIFVALNAALSEWLAHQRNVGLRTSIPGAAESAYVGHQAIYDAIAAHDVEAADRAMTEHLQLVSRYYWEAMEDAGEPGAAQA
jgi:DNA-binding FadR family transcriptional regulator